MVRRTSTESWIDQKGETVTHTFAVLLGNGFSLAYNPELSVQNLTSELQSQFESLGASDAEKALTSLAEESHRAGDQGFEAMLGPLETTARALDALTALVPVAAPTSSMAKLHDVRALVEAIHRVGLSVVLRTIAARSSGAGQGSLDNVWEFIEGLTNLGPARFLSVATLSYDGLTHSGLLSCGSPADLADGRYPKTHELAPDLHIEGLPLRTEDDMPDDKSPIIQLHGSLGWLRNPDDGAVWKFPLDALRYPNHWDSFRAGTTDWSPVVVLTDQKERTVVRWPFALAYDVFQQRLIRSDRWLIAGYGLGDNPVNDLFRSAWSTRRRLGLGEPQVLVVDIGLPDLEQHRTEVARLFGIPKSRIVVSNAGIPAVVRVGEWDAWTA